jgi:hypothetical protein
VLDQLGGSVSESGNGGDNWYDDEYDDDTDYVTRDDGNTDLYDVAVGMCIDEEELFGEDYFVSVDVVDCAQPHYAELYSVFDVAVGELEYPGDDEVWELADAGCVEDFGVYVGVSWEKSDFDYYYFYPSQENWDVGDHEVMCLAVDINFEPYTGSVRNGEI